MRAVVLRTAGGPEQLGLEEVPTPAVGAGEALVRVHAAGITRDELEWRADRLPAIPSYELSGIVADLGPGVGGLAVGDAVFGMTAFDRDGVAADYAAISAKLLAPKPRTLSHAQAATVPLAALSAWQGLFDHGGLAQGERVLIHGATGGVGQFAVQLASHHGAHVIATTSAPGIARAADLGAEIVIDHTAGPWDAEIEPVDLVFDTAGGERLARSPGALREGGRLVSVVEEPPATPGVNSVYFIVEHNRDQLSQIAVLLDSGWLPPAVDSVFMLEDAVQAFERSMAADKRGKVVFEVSPVTDPAAIRS